VAWSNRGKNCSIDKQLIDGYLHCSHRIFDGKNHIPRNFDEPADEAEIPVAVRHRSIFVVAGHTGNIRHPARDAERPAGEIRIGATNASTQNMYPYRGFTENSTLKLAGCLMTKPSVSATLNKAVAGIT